MAFKTADIKAAAEKKYIDAPIETEDGTEVLLVNVLRLSEDDRKALRNIPEGDDATMLDFYRNTVKSIADTPEGAEKIIAEFGENLSFYAELLDYYNKATEAGEA